MSFLSEWNPYDRYVQGGFKDGQFANAAYTMIAAGPPRLVNLGGALSVARAVGQQAGDEMAYPIGLTQQLNIAQNGQFIEVFEIGSVRGFFLRARNVNQMSLSRVLYHGPSLLRMLYAYYEDSTGPVLIDSVFPNIGIQNVANKHDVIQSPGYENFFINLLSDLFTQPIGILLIFKDSNLETLGSAYCEQAYVPSHNLGTDAQGVMVQETVAIQFERVVPVRIQGVELLSAREASQLEVLRGSGAAR